jgi:hypothetical protein
MKRFLPSAPNGAHLLQINNNLLAENTARTQDEEQLYSAWQQSEMYMILETKELKLNQNPSEITSQIEINYDGDLADNMKWVEFKIARKKGNWPM